MKKNLVCVLMVMVAVVSGKFTLANEMQVEESKQIITGSENLQNNNSASENFMPVSAKTMNETDTNGKFVADKKEIVSDSEEIISETENISADCVENFSSNEVIYDFYYEMENYCDIESDDLELIELEQMEEEENFVAETEENEIIMETFKDCKECDMENLTVIDSADLTAEILENRDGKLIIEECIGEVVNENLDGKILNCEDENYDYISYSNLENVSVGDIVQTYYVYNPDSSEVDDILYRFDYVVETSEE